MKTPVNTRFFSHLFRKIGRNKTVSSCFVGVIILPYAYASSHSGAKMLPDLANPKYKKAIAPVILGAIAFLYFAAE